MPTHLISKKVNLDLIYPGLLPRLLDGMAEAESLGSRYKLYYGYRTPQESRLLYLQGRTMPGKIVTNAKPWQSVHNYGAACDFALMLGDGSLTWETKNGEYDVLRAVMEKRGLQVGVPSVPGGDRGHAQLALSSKLGRKEVDVLRELEKVVKDANLDIKAAWAKLDEWGFNTSP